MAKPKIAVIIGTTRVTRFGERPAKWVYYIAAARADTLETQRYRAFDEQQGVKA
jgi:hypothetical protein